MNIKERIKSVGFWVGLISTVFLALGAFGVEVGDETASAIINAVCSLLVVFGIATSPKMSDAASGDGDADGLCGESTQSDDGADDETII